MATAMAEWAAFQELDIGRDAFQEMCPASSHLCECMSAFPYSLPTQYLSSACHRALNKMQIKNRKSER